MFYRSFWAILFTCLATEVYCQQTNSFEENRIFRYSNLVQLEGRSKQLISLPRQGKKMILEFFSSTCIVCFRMMPKMDTLQEKYKNDIDVILIGKYDKNIRSIYGRYSNRFNLKLSVAFDSIIFSKFRIQEVPKYVWIDENGIIKAVTGIEEMNDDNIRLFINNKNIVRTKVEKLYEFDPNQLLFISENGGVESDIQYRSLLTEWKQGYPFYIPVSLTANTETDKFQAIGVTFGDLYRYAIYGIVNWDINHSFYGKVFPTPIIMGKNGKISMPEEGEKRFCYSLYKFNSKLTDSLIKNHLLKELEFYFGYKAKIISCAVPCWKLTVSDERLLPASNHSKTEIKKDAAGFTLLNQSISKVVQIIYKYNPLEVPIIDFTGITYNIDLSIVAAMEDMADIAKSLASFGLKLDKGEVQMQTIILEEIK